MNLVNVKWSHSFERASSLVSILLIKNTFCSRLDYLQSFAASLVLIRAFLTYPISWRNSSSKDVVLKIAFLSGGIREDYSSEAVLNAEFPLANVY